MISPQTDISRLIERLANTGLVSRDRCGEDRRVVWVNLTSKGKAILKKLTKPLEELHRSQFQDLSDRDLATLNRLLFRARGSNDG
jgi:DNA-binding MarR family transcriptional regulator